MLNMEQWVKDWVKEQRDQGVKCLEVKMRGKMYYVYHSSTYWDKALKKPRKISKYLGALDPDMFKYSKVYHVNLKDHSMISEVPKKVRYLEEKLGLNIFPQLMRS
jgi:hypothetical protein